MTDSSFDLSGTFSAVVEALNDTGTPHAFIGALPVLAWGRVRATTDLDLVVLAEQGWQEFTDALVKRGFKQRRSVGPAEPADALPDIAVFESGDAVHVRVDVFIAKTTFEREVIATARRASVLGTTIQLASPEASIIYKLIAQRPRDVVDVESVFEARSAAGDALDWNFLDHWAREWGITDRLATYAQIYRPGA